VSTATEVKLDDITAEPPKYPHLAKTYAGLLSRGYKFSPILCQRRDDGVLVVIDGHHRYSAYVLAGRTTIAAFIH
jgi:hypothetical protein